MRSLGSPFQSPNGVPTLIYRKKEGATWFGSARAAALMPDKVTADDLEDLREALDLSVNVPEERLEEPYEVDSWAEVAHIRVHLRPIEWDEDDVLTVSADQYARAQTTTSTVEELVSQWIVTEAPESVGYAIITDAPEWKDEAKVKNPCGKCGARMVELFTSIACEAGCK